MPLTRNIAEPASRTSFRVLPRRWLQFSIRTLLAVTLGACCLAAWVAHKRDQAAQQQKAYQLILAKHGATNFGPESARPPWLRCILGEDVSGSGGCIEFGGRDVNDANLAQLSSLGQLTRLSLNRTQVTDRGLVHLRKLSRLAYLSLDKTQISDDGLKSLHACRSLEFLSLGGTRTTPAGVESLRAALPYLRVIASQLSYAHAGILSESRMREIRPSGSMSGKWNRGMVAILWHSQTKGRANREHKQQPKPRASSRLYK